MWSFPLQINMRSFKLVVQFNGSQWYGWQAQKQFPAVQEQIEKALCTLYSHPEVPIDGSGRTDAGVHAFGLCATFTEPKPSKFRTDTLRKGLNALLPESIRIRSLTNCASDFHARFSCIGKTYIYFIDNSSTGSPILAPYTWHMRKKLDIDAMQESIQHLEGKHDFSAFTVQRQQLKGHAIRTIYQAGITQIGHIISIHFTGDGFLYKMVRSMVGEIVGIGMGSYPPSHTLEALNSAKREDAGMTAPPQGLFLGRCYYSQEEVDASLKEDSQSICLQALLNFNEDH
jgi:tRNA pseudouridine38-40 synthase